VPLYLQEREAWANSFQAIATPILLAIGGLFALYKFIFEGAFSRRMQPNASVEAIVGEDAVFLRVSLTAENIGKRKVNLDGEYTRLSVSFLTKTEDWSEAVTHPVLREQEFIKPGETVGDQVWLTILDEDVLAVDLKFYVFSKGSEGWMHREIVSLVQQQGIM
jgi:hypothetical protein